MRRISLLWASLLALPALVAGCRNEPDILITSPEEDEQIVAAAEDGWDSLVPEATEDPQTRPRFIPADKAEQAPELELYSFEGTRKELTPGYRGRVTMVVFWSMDIPATRAAPKHIHDLARKYRRVGVRALSVVERTKTYRYAPRFLASQGIRIPTYYDDFSALRRMGRAADESVRQEVPCFFMVDGEGRVRFFKRGFSYTGAGSIRTPGAVDQVIENAAPNETIESFLRQLLEER